MLVTHSIETEQLITELTKTLPSDPNPKNRYSATQTLGKIGDENAIPILCKIASNDPIPEVRGSAIRALEKIGDESINLM